MISSLIIYLGFFDSELTQISFTHFEIWDSYAFFIYMSFLYILDNNFLVILDMDKLIFLHQLLC